MENQKTNIQQKNVQNQKETLIELKHIKKVFEDGVTVIEDLSLEVKKGEFVTLLGPSGCGKTTILRMIGGFEKPTFGSTSLVEFLKSFDASEGIESIEFVGLCTDICVISNALLIKAFLPEVKITVDSACCAGVTPKSHENALEAMKMCQIDIK